MDTKRYLLCELGDKMILLGKQGESGALRIEFDCTPWIEEYPAATIKLFVFNKAHRQDDPILPVLGSEGTLRVWIVGEDETAASGHGVIELVLLDADTGSTLKSATGYTTVVKSPSAGIEAREAQAGYVRYDLDQSEILTEEQKAIARNNIGAGTGNGTGGGGIAVETDPTVPSWAKNKTKPSYTAEEVGALPNTYVPPNQTAAQVGADPAGTAAQAIGEHNVQDDAHEDIRALIEGLTTRLNALANSDDTTLDQMAEVVAYIKNNKSLIDAVTTGKVSTSDIVNNLTTNVSTKVLSAAQGVALKALIDAIVIPTTLPNPQPIVINGESYDGSTKKEITIQPGSSTGGAAIDDTTPSATTTYSSTKIDALLNEQKEANDAQDERLTALDNTVANLEAGAYIDYDANVKAVAHRGYSTTAPENTIPAYILAKKNGFNYAECDVSFTSDGVAVLLHDASIDRTSDGTGNIGSMTYAQAMQYDFGIWKSSTYAGTKIPTFAEFMQYCRALGLHPYIELKQNGGYSQAQITGIVDTIKAYGMDDNSTYISFNPTFLGYVKEADGKARIGYLADITSTTIQTANGLKTDENEVFIDTSYTNVTADKVALCIANGLPLEVYTVNSQATIEGLNPYISGVTSDSLIAGKILYNKHLTYTAPEVPDDGGDEPTTVPATSVTLSASTLTFTNSDTKTLTATVEPSNTTDTVVWTTNASDVATVSDGVVTPKGNGSATITATAGSVSASCTVTVEIAESGGEEDTRKLLYNWDLTSSLTDTVAGETAVLSEGAVQDANGVSFNSNSQYMTIGSAFGKGRTIEVDVGKFDFKGTTDNHVKFICGSYQSSNNNTYRNGLMWRKNTTIGWTFYGDGWSSEIFQSDTYDTTDVSVIDGKTVALKLDADGYATLYLNGESCGTSSVQHKYAYGWCIGNPTSINDGGQLYNITITGVRIYENDN